MVKLWDPRSNAAVGSLAQPDRVCKQNVIAELKEEPFADSHRSPCKHWKSPENLVT